jgi:uncharacterized protein involved in cysteine biosynthesis
MATSLTTREWIHSSMAESMTFCKLASDFYIRHSESFGMFVHRPIITLIVIIVIIIVVIIIIHYSCSTVGCALGANFQTFAGKYEEKTFDSRTSNELHDTHEHVHAVITWLHQVAERRRRRSHAWIHELTYIPVIDLLEGSVCHSSHTRSRQ